MGVSRYFYRDKQSYVSNIGNWKSCHATCQNIRTLDQFKPKKGKGKTQKRVWSNDKKKGEHVWGKFEGT